MHEAAHAGLPIVIVDKGLSEVAIDGVNALYANNSAADLARKTVQLLADKDMQSRVSAESKKNSPKNQITNYKKTEQFCLVER